jgi:Domain of unknown function (DUF4276)
MFGIVGEDNSDVEVLKHLIRRIAGDQSLTIKSKGYHGCHEMLRKGADQIRAFNTAYDINRFVICYDSDKEDPQARFEAIKEQIVQKTKLGAEFCALVPVQEIEAWVLADLAAVSKVILSWKPDVTIPSPESINDPKEHLKKLSRRYKKPLYSPPTHNPEVAKHLDLQTVWNKCPSFRPLHAFVSAGQCNVSCV